jgi:enoyl-CoA hydratase/carnithine racemase
MVFPRASHPKPFQKSGPLTENVSFSAKGPSLVETRRAKRRPLYRFRFFVYSPGITLRRPAGPEALMTYETLLVEVGSDHVGRLTFNRPDQLNTFNTVMAGELHQALIALDENPDCRVIVVKGAGRGFSAGIDISEFSGKTAAEYQKWTAHMERPLLTVTRIATPVIAQVHGPAVANGTGLVAVSDLAVAEEGAKFGLTAIKVGLSCLGPVIPVARLVGRKKALEWLYMGEIFDAGAALDAGLINAVVPADQLEATAEQWAARMAAMSPYALGLSKQAFHQTMDLDLEKAFHLMNEAFARLCMSEDAQHGVRAFLNKEKPVWKGR